MTMTHTASGLRGLDERTAPTRLSPVRRWSAPFHGLAPILFGLAVLSLTLPASPAVAAPTCWDNGGNTVKCGTPSAMAVGQPLSPEQLLDRQARFSDSSFEELGGLICVLGGLFLLIALMPDFDGWGPEGGPSDD